MMATPQSPALLVTRIGAALLVIVGASQCAVRMVDGDAKDLAPVLLRAPGVFAFPDKDVRLEVEANRAASAPRILLIGNSHTYALPGAAPGDTLRVDDGHTLVDAYAAALTAAGVVKPQVWRLASPNLLPTEMLTRILALDQAGFRADVVVLGLTWRNVVRGATLRRTVGKLLCATPSPVDEPAIAGGPLLRAFFEAERTRACVSAETTLVSHADEWDAALAEHVGALLPLLDKSVELRTLLYKAVVHGAQTALIAQRPEAQAYDVVPEDLALNLAALDALAAAVSARGTRLAVYLAPERTDLPPLVGSAHDAERTALLERLAGGGAHIIDARGAVANEFWGYDGAMPDRSHFRGPGHIALASLLAAQTAPLLAPHVPARAAGDAP